MAYTSAVTYKGAQPFHGFVEVAADLDVSGTAVAGTGISLDLELAPWAPDDGTTYDAPYFVDFVVRDAPTAGLENITIHWDKDNDDTTNGYTRIQIDDNGIAANGLANLEVRFRIVFHTMAKGGIG